MEPARRQPPASGSLDNSDNNNIGSELPTTSTTTATNHNNNNDNNKNNNNEPCVAQRVWISSHGSEKQSRIRFPRLAQSDGAHSGINLDTKGNRNSIESAPKLEVTSPRFIMISHRASQQISDKDRIIKEALASRKCKLYRRLPGRGTSPDKYYRRFHATTNLHSKVFCLDESELVGINVP